MQRKRPVDGTHVASFFDQRAHCTIHARSLDDNLTYCLSLPNTAYHSWESHVRASTFWSSVFRLSSHATAKHLPPFVGLCVRQIEVKCGDALDATSGRSCRTPADCSCLYSSDTRAGDAFTAPMNVRRFCGVDPILEWCPASATQNLPHTDSLHLDTVQLQDLCVGHSKTAFASGVLSRTATPPHCGVA